jgi:hypothetical protein
MVCNKMEDMEFFKSSIFFSNYSIWRKISYISSLVMVELFGGLVGKVNFRAPFGAM